MSGGKPLGMGGINWDPAGLFSGSSSSNNNCMGNQNPVVPGGSNAPFQY